MPTTTRYISCADTAKMIRKALKDRFPGIKFSVRSHVYAGGASINIKWENGPKAADVDALVAPYRGADFDGMIDMETYREAWMLPDGEVLLAKVQGTEGQKGTIPGYERGRPHDDAERVCFAAKYIFCERSYNRAFLEEVAGDVAWQYRLPVPEIKESEYDGHAYLDTSGAKVGNGCFTLGELVYQEIRTRDF
ncbi:MAG TPA: LPD29 domain-containing protein [Longimicrobiaceae bacterium]|nr:LPD29 domain-containing protein [Longimicrobiaceae bacterium]